LLDGIYLTIGIIATIGDDGINGEIKIPLTDKKIRPFPVSSSKNPVILPLSHISLL